MTSAPPNGRASRRRSTPSAATRITVAGVAISATVGIGAAVTARAASDQKAKVQQSTAVKGTSTALVAQARQAERKKFRQELRVQRHRYQQIINRLAADYQQRLNAANVVTVVDDSSSGYSGGSTGGSSASGSGGGGSYTAPSGGGGGGSSSGGSGGSSGGSAPAPVTQAS